MSPTTIANRYDVQGLLGVGGMGSVYRVFDRELREVVALKFLNRELLHSPAALDRFRQEVVLARRVTHRNVARTFDIGEHQGERFLTMEYVAGESLAHLLGCGGALAPSRAMDISLGICDGLAAAHAAGIVHRDLKPENVLIETSGRVVITDFAIACARTSDSQASHGIVGTAAYIAPEQLEGIADIDGRADIYALGALTFEMLTGQRAWPGDDVVVVAMSRLSQPPPDPRTHNSAINRDLAEIVSRCMSRDRDARFADVGALALALGNAIKGAGATLDAHAAGEVATAVRAFRVAPLVQPDDRTVAVLPFKNLGAPEDEYLADELTDDLVDALSAARGLNVRPRRTVMRHITADHDLRALGRALDVQVVVEGTVRRREGVVRISARALGVAQDLQLWARRFERPASEVLAINDTVARDVAEALGAHRVAPPRRAISDSRALELYLNARRGLRASWQGFGDLDGVVRAFEQALELVPGDPAILSGYAMARARQVNFSFGTDKRKQFDETRAVAEKAIALAPHLAEPWLAIATLHQVLGDWALAIRALRKALLAAPGLQKAYELLGTMEVEIGNIDEGQLRFETALTIDRESLAPRWELARIHGFFGRWSTVDDLVAPFVESKADKMLRAFCCARMNLWRGKKVFELGVEVGADRTSELLGFYDRAVTTGSSGLTEEKLEEHLATYPRPSRVRPLLHQTLVELAAFEGKTEMALRGLRRAVDEQLYDVAWLDHCPLFESLRTHPELVAARSDMLRAIAPFQAAIRSNVT